MKEKELFIKSLNTLLSSWGSDTPCEVIWGANELLEWYELEYNVKLNIRFVEVSEPDYEGNFEKVIESIKNSTNERQK